MPLPSDVVGCSTEPITHEIDARWIMAYAAGIDDRNERYLATTRAEGIVAHPLFPVCIEWPLVLAARRLVPRDVLPAHEAGRGIHATHDLLVHRLIRPGDELTTTATVEGVERRKPGAYEVLRLDTIDASGAPVATTRMGSLFLGVDVDGPDRPATSNATGAAGATGVHLDAPASTRRSIATNAAHVYTECARIWNPIHTDPAFAAAAGLPAIILHGTATLAMAITDVVDRYADGDPQRVTRLSCRFAAMVQMPSEITIRSQESEDVRFDVQNAEGEPAIVNGRVALASS